jgi:hypothetical protein
MLLMVSQVEELLVNHQVYQPVRTLHLELHFVDGTGQIQTNKQDGYLYLTTK